MPSTLRPLGRFLGRQVLVVVGVLGNLLGARVLPLPVYLLCLALAGAFAAQVVARRGRAPRAAVRGGLVMWLVLLAAIAASTTLAPAQASPRTPTTTVNISLAEEPALATALAPATHADGLELR